MNFITAFCLPTLSTKQTQVLLAIFILGIFSTLVQGDPLVHAYNFSGNNGNDAVGSAHGTLANGASVSGNALQLNGVVGQGLALNGSGVTNSAVSGITGRFGIEMQLTRSPDDSQYPAGYAFGTDTSNYLIFNPHRGGEAA